MKVPEWVVARIRAHGLEPEENRIVTEPDVESRLDEVIGGEPRGDWQGWPDPQHFTPHGQQFGGESVNLALFGVSPGTPSPSKLDEPPIAAKLPKPDPAHPFKDPLARELATPRGRPFVPDQSWAGPNAVLPSGWPASASPVADALRRPAKPRSGDEG